MIEIKRHRWLPALKEKWQMLCKDNTLVSPNQQYDFVLNEWKNYFMYCYWQKMFPEFWEVLKDGETIMIAPLCKVINGTYKIFGRVNGCSVCDFVYNSEAAVKEGLLGEGSLLERINKPILFSRIKKDSWLYVTLSNIIVDEKSLEHVRIPFSDEYLAFYGHLHKSVRQNLRTAYNRAYKDGMEIRVVVVNGHKSISSNCIDGIAGTRSYSEALLSDKEHKSYFEQMMDVYINRHENKYNVRTGKYKKWYLKHLNFTTKNLKHLPYSCNVMLFFNNHLAAFMGGFLNVDGTELLVPRLSIDENYNFYSPGMLLVNETVRYLACRTACRMIDLAEGAEQYKLKMGGEIYHTAEFWINK